MMETEHNVTPCYLSYATFKNTIQTLALNGTMPRQIDPSILTTMGGSMRKMFLAALRFFVLIDECGTPTERLKKLSVASESEWKDYLQVMLRDRYADLIENLADASPKMLRDKFSESFNGIGSSLVEPAIRFLVSAARDADIPVSPHLSIRKVRAPNAPRKRNQKVVKQNRIEDEPVSEKPFTPEQSFRMSLMDKFPSFDPSWGEQQQSAWFEAFKKLMDIKQEAEEI